MELCTLSYLASYRVGKGIATAHAACGNIMIWCASPMTDAGLAGYKTQPCCLR